MSQHLQRVDGCLHAQDSSFWHCTSSNPVVSSVSLSAKTLMCSTFPLHLHWNRIATCRPISDTWEKQWPCVMSLCMRILPRGARSGRFTLAERAVLTLPSSWCRAPHCTQAWSNDAFSHWIRFERKCRAFECWSPVDFPNSRRHSRVAD